MRSIEENIETLSRAILDEANADAQRILADARAKAEIIRQRAHEQAAAERKEILDRAHQEADRLRGQSIATAQLRARTLQLEHREKLLDSVFTAARKDMMSVLKWTDYDAVARRLLREAITHLGAGEARLHTDAVTGKSLSSSVIAEVSKEMNVQIEVAEPLAKGSGVLVETKDGHLQYENTLDDRLNRLQNVLRSPVYHILIGETL
jgi:V/A-type H+-transporting ATPase subunit E